MKLLFITQKVDKNDSNLGFFHLWLERFSEKLDKAYVICLSQGENQLPDNVQVFSLGKEKGFSKIRQFFRLQKFLFKHLKQVDGVFVHMSPIYAILSWPLAKMFRKKMILWFVHKSVSWKLKIAEKMVDIILTVSSESCQLKNKRKIQVVGHGIDVEMFRPLPIDLKDKAKNVLKLVFVGRIAPIKDQKTLIRAMDVLVNQRYNKNVKLTIIGSPVTKQDRNYAKEVKQLIRDKRLENYIEFFGTVAYEQLNGYYNKNDILINLCPTGGMDKAVLEAMSCSCLVLVCNMAFKNILNGRYLFEQKNYNELADKIIGLQGAPRDGSLREIIVKNHNLDNLIDRIKRWFQNPFAN